MLVFVCLTGTVFQDLTVPNHNVILVKKQTDQEDEDIHYNTLEKFTHICYNCLL